MGMVCGLDLHRPQISFDAMELLEIVGEAAKVSSPTRLNTRRFLGQPPPGCVTGSCTTTSTSISMCCGQRSPSTFLRSSTRSRDREQTRRVGD